MENYGSGIKKFLSLSIDDLKKMRTNAISERQIEEERWRKVVENIFLEHYLLRENQSMAFCPVFARLFYIEIQRQLKSNKPYTSQIINNPDNALSPIFDIISELNDGKKIGSNERADTAKYSQYIDLIRKQVDKTIASNGILADIFQKVYTEIRLFANSCIRRDIVDYALNNYTTQHIPLSQIAIFKDNLLNEANYFFRELKMSFIDFKKYFPEDYSLIQCLKYYNTLKEPENQNKKEIAIIENSYYCAESDKTIIRYYLERETTEDLEENPRIRDYQVFWYFQINAEDTTYGKIDDKEYQIFLDLRSKQMHYKHLLEIKGKIEKPRVLDVISLAQEKQLETNLSDGVKIGNAVREKNLEGKKNISILPQQIQAFGGNLRSQNLEDPENNQRYILLEAIHYKNIEEFASNLNFDEAQKKVAIPLAMRRDTTATEFKDLLFASTADKRQLEILEGFTGSFYMFMIKFFIGNFARKITEYYLKLKGDTTEYIGHDYEKIMEDELNDVVSLKLDLKEERISESPFAIVNQNEIVRKAKEEYRSLLAMEKQAETLIEKKQIRFAIEDLQNQYGKDIKNITSKILENYKNYKKYLFSKKDYADMAVQNCDPDFALFILEFNKFSKTIKFNLASAEANILDNQENQNYLRLVDIVQSKTLPTQDPEIIREGNIMLNLIPNLGDIGKSLNLENKLILDKGLEEAIQNDKLQRMQEQIQLSQAINPTQTNQG